MNESTKWLYEKLSSHGYNVGASAEIFDSLMVNNPESRKWAYNTAQKHGYNVGEYDMFERLVGAMTDGVETTESGSVVVSPAEAKENADSIDQFMENRDTLYSGLQDYNTGVISGAEQRRIDRAASEMEAQAEATRQRLQEDGTIDLMEWMKDDAREAKRKTRREAIRYGLMAAEGVAPQDVDLTSMATKHRQNKLLQEKLDVALDMARAGENQDGLRGVENFGLGLWDSATRLSTWDFGASDIVNNLTLQQIVEKWENDPSSLTATEQKVLDGIGMATAVQEMYSDQVGIGYNVGQSLPESAGFMASMALNPASGLGKSLARNAVRTYGRNSIRKNLYRLGGDFAETAIMTATTGAGRVAADALERINGSSTYEIGENGVIMYGGQKDQETVGNAVIKAIGSNFIENYSEALGEYFDPLLGMSRKVAAGGLRKMNLNKWADALSDVQPSQMTASIRSLREKTKFGGIFGEVMEEEIGMALNAISGVGDYTFSKEKADKEGKQWIFDLENQLTTVLSCAIMSGTLNGVEQVSSVAARRRMEKNAKNAEQSAANAFGEQFAELRESIDQASPEGMVDVLRDVYMDQGYSLEQKRKLAEYAAARLQMQYYNAADAKARREVNKTQQGVLDAYEAGRHAQLPTFYNIEQEYRNSEEAINTSENAENIWAAIETLNRAPLEEHDMIINDFTEEEQQLIRQYRYNAARVLGAVNSRVEQAEDLIDEYRGQIAPFTKPDGTVTTAILGDNVVFVMEQNENGDAVVYTNDGRKIFAKIRDLEHVETHNAEDLIERFRQSTNEAMDIETENAFEHHPKTQAPQVGLQLQSPEGEVVITAVNGNMVEIVPAVYKDGQVQPKEGAEPRTITVDDAYAWQDSYYQGLDDAAAATASQPTIDNMSAETTENEGTPTEQIEQSVSEEITDGQIAENQPTEEVAESIAPAAPQTARERVPKDKKGNPIYEQTDADTAWDAIVEETEGNVEMAQSVAEQMLANKKAALEKLQKGKAKAGANVAQIIANEKKHQEAISKAEADVKAWERISQVNAIRQQKAELERAAAEKAEAEQRKAEEARILAEQEEQARLEREQLNGVPDMVDDIPADARARGFRRVNGHKVDRQEIVPSLQGKEVGVKFANDMIANGRVAVIEAETLQPSHLQGQRNPAHFIDEAQPKERNDEASIASARRIASNIRPEEITTSVTAYTGAPTVNMRGEAIQGNSRSDALRVMWAEHPDQAEKYKQYLIDHAEEFGLNAEEVAAMQHPVLVNMLDVSDADAINLGQYVAQDTESGGTERIKPKNVARKMGSDIRSYANILLRSSDEEASFSELVDKNGVEVLKWMNTKGYITPTQYASAFDSKGNMTAEAKNDLRGILYQSIFQGGNTQLEEQFNAMPAKAQKAILATAYRDYDSPESERMVSEIQSSIRAYYALSHDRAFVDAKNYAEAKEAMLVWSRQYQMDDVTGESFLPSENFSNFALELAVRYKGNTQSATQNLFNELFDLIQGTKEASLFEEADNRPRTLAEAIKETLNIDYNGQNGSNALVGDDTSSQEGRQGSTGDSASGELSQNNESTADDRGRAAGDSDTRAEETGGADTAPVAESSDEYILNEGEKTAIDRSTLSQLKNFQRILQGNLFLIEQSEKSGELTEELSARKKKDTAWLKAVKDSIARKEQIKARNKWNVKSGNHPVPLDTVKQMFAEWNENADIQALFDRVFDTFSKLGVNVTFEDNIGSGTMQGWFSIGENRVKLPMHMVYSNRLDNQQKASVMVHEMIHGVTKYVLWAAKLSENGRNKLGINLSQEMITAAEQLNEIYGIIKKDKRFKGQYGLTSVDEMVSELSEPKFRVLLKETTVWDKIVEAIRNILGLNAENNALDAASRALDYIIDNYDADLYRKVSSLGKKKATANIFDIAEDVLAARELQAKSMVISKADDNLRFRDGAPFFSNAERAVEIIKQNKATPEQWLAMIKKDGGLKAGEDKWMGLSDWLNEQKEKGVKTLTKDEVLQFIRENQIEIEEVNYEEGVEDARYDAEEAIRENLQELFDMKVDEVRDENPEQIYMSDIYEEAFERVCAEVGYNKDDAPFVYTNATITLRWYPDVTTEELLDLSRRLGFNYSDSLNIPNAEQINSTRLDYTTEGLDNKKEIAFVVPTIDSWNRNDETHFGDAGEGRAVAWVRFGETTDKDGKRVLVIDEVQSKRHDEGRAKGYRDLRDYDKKMVALEEEAAELLARRNKLIKVLDEKYGGFTKYLKHSFDGQRTSLVPNPSVMTAEEIKEWNETSQDSIREREDELKKLKRGVPDAPFDKNYHELVMKRMLRYAAENGFDKVAWTKGAQQAERYNIGNVVNFIEVENWGSDYEGVEYEEGEVDEPKNTRGVMMDTNDDPIAIGVNREGVIVKALHKNELLGKKLSDVVGKDLAASIISKEGRGMVNANEIRIGAEGMNGFYDEMIPRFMNKYTKKWGTTVGEVTLPNVEAAGRTMWSVDVTPEMRESVMQGQPMFREGMGAISDREVSYENDPIAKFQGKPRYYGKRAAAFAERERRRMENAAKEAAEMLGIEAEIITDASTLQGRKAKAKGWYDIVNKKVVVVVPNHVSMGDAVRTVLHEGVAHHGLRELFGDGFDTMLDNVYNNVAPELKARIDAIAERTGVSTQVATEEYLASLAETTNFEEAQRRGWWQQIKQFFVDMLNKLAMPGLNLKEDLTDNELRYLLWRSYKNLVEPNSYAKPLGFAEDVVKQKELKVGEYAEKTPATPMAAEDLYNYGKYTLSDIDSGKGGNFYQDSNGNINLVEIGQEIMDEIGLPHVPFRINESMAKHVQKQHPEMKAKSYEEIVSFIVWTMKNFDHVRQGSTNNTYIFSVENNRKIGRRAITIIIPSNNEEFLGVKTSGYESVERLQKRPLLWEKGANLTSTADTASANVTSKSAEQGGGLNSSASNQNNDLSSGKDSDNSSSMQENEGNIRNSEEIIAEVERESAALGVPVRIARSVEELPDEDTRKRAVDGKLKGYYDPRTNEVVLYAPNTDDANDAKRTILHEIVGHKGLRSLIGEQRYDKAMLQLMYMLPADVRDAVLRRAERHGWNAAIAMDEYLAEQAERDVQPTWWGKVNAKIRALLRNLGFDVKLTDADVTYLLWRSRKKLQGDSLNDMAVNAILKQAARKSAEAEAWNEQAFKDAEMRDFEQGAMQTLRHRIGDAQNEYDSTMKSMAFKQRESWQDSMRSLKVFMDILEKESGKKIVDFENAYMYENAMSSANLMEMQMFRHDVYGRLLKAIHELMESGAKYEEIVDYMMAKHGLERNEKMARAEAEVKVERWKEKAVEEMQTKAAEELEKQNQRNAVIEARAKSAYKVKKQRLKGQLERGAISEAQYDHYMQMAEEAYQNELATMKTTHPVDVIAEIEKINTKAEQKLNEYWADHRDYSGLTALTGKDGVAGAESAAMQMIADFEAKHNTDLLWNETRACTQTILNISHDAGILSDEVYGELWNQYEYYIPLRGFDETTAEEMYTYVGDNKSPYNAPIKTAKGRKSKADDPIATIATMAESAIVEANRNRLKQRFLYMVERHRTELASVSSVWVEKDPITGDCVTRFANIPNDATPEEAAQAQKAFEERMEQLHEQEPERYYKASEKPNIPYRVEKKANEHEHQIIVKRNGKDVVITINGDPRVAQAINGLTNPEAVEGFSKFAGNVNRFLSANFTTRNPAFVVSNFVRDGFYTNSMVWVKEGPAYARRYNQNWVKATKLLPSLVSKYKKYESGDKSALDMSDPVERAFYEFMIHGGETGYTVINSVEDYKGIVSGDLRAMQGGVVGNAKKAVQTVSNMVDTFGRWAEDTSRFAAYLTSRQMGRTVTKSIWDAKEISVNFNKKGSGRKMTQHDKGLNSLLGWMSQQGRNLYVFWNAGVQGLTNFGKAAKEHPGKMAGLVGAYFGLGMLVAAVFGGQDDDDDYWNLPEYVRRNNICHRVGDKWITLPLPIEIRAIYGMGELAMSWIAGKEDPKKIGMKIVQQVSQVAPIDMMAEGGGLKAFIPSWFKPIAEVYINTDWTGMPIYRKRTPFNEYDPTWMLAFKSTSPEYVAISRAINEATNENLPSGKENKYDRGWADSDYFNNPAAWEHVVEGYLGGLATTFNQTKKSVMALWNKDLREMRNIPVISRFVKSTPENEKNTLRNDYFEAKKEVDKLRAQRGRFRKESKNIDKSLTEEQLKDVIDSLTEMEEMSNATISKWDELEKDRKYLEQILKEDPEKEPTIKGKEWKVSDLLDGVTREMITLVEAYRD